MAKNKREEKLAEMLKDEIDASKARYKANAPPSASEILTGIDNQNTNGQYPRVRLSDCRPGTRFEIDGFPMEGFVISPSNTSVRVMFVNGVDTRISPGVIVITKQGSYSEIKARRDVKKVEKIKKAARTVKKDRFGVRVGSKCARMNATVSYEWRSIDDMARRCQLEDWRVKGNLSWMIRDGFVEKRTFRGKDQFRLKPHEEDE